MNKKNLILSMMIILIVFLGLSVVSAQNNTEDILEIESKDTLTTNEITIELNDTNNQIQEKINSLNDGDVLNFEKGEYKNISIYVNKSITINGNGATLYGYDTPSINNTPEIITNTTNEGGYAISNFATLYILKTDNLVLKNLNFIGGANSNSTYSNCLIYNYYSNNTKIINNTLNGSSWGLWLQNCNDGIVENNTIQNQQITGILNFQSPRTIIRNNTVINAKNHGIDVRHGVGPNVKVLDNTIIGSKEGIYLLHSAKHTVTGNNIINCTLSSITCCGASHIIINDNKLYNSRIGILLGGGAPVGGSYTGYNNITIGENEWKLDTLPMPPSFAFYVGEAKGDYASTDSMMGTYTDSSISNVTYVEYTEIETPAEIIINYDNILKPTGNSVEITSAMTNTEIQEKINELNDGDTLIFEENAIFENITLYIDKNIKVIGNNATLKGLSTVNETDRPEKIQNTTSDGGYAISYYAILYIVNNTDTVISDLNIISNYPTYINPNNPEYITACIYAQNSKNLTITGCNVDGASWGIFVGYQQNGCPNSTITNNKVTNQYTTGIICFGSAQSIIANNTITNAINHGIDVRFPAGFGVTVYNNTITGAKEGIYLLHSYGHKVYGNTILDSKISSITCYGSYDEYIFNNTLTGSRIAILLGGGYHGVTIGKNTIKLDQLPFPPTFAYWIVQSENKYNNATNIQGTYYDSQAVNITVNNINVGYKKGFLEINLKDSQGNPIINKTTTITIQNNTYSTITNENGIAYINLTLTTGSYEAIIHTASDYYNKAGNSLATITVNDDRTTPIITAPSKTVYLQTMVNGVKYQIILKDVNGNVLSQKQITINFNGKNYITKTDTKGIATVNIKATGIGVKKATIKIDSDDNYKGVTKTATIKITKESTKIIASKKTFKAKTKNKKYTITLKTSSGKTISKVKVTLKINGKTYKSTTNSKGLAIFKITKLTKQGKYTAKIKSSTTTYFSANSKTVKITVKK